MKTNIELIVFRVGEEILAVNIKEVKEVSTSSRIYPIPKVSEFILGNINIRGTVWLLLDLERILLKKSSKSLSKKYYLLTKGDNKVAFQCDEIIDILEVIPGEIQKIEVDNEEAKQFFTGQVYYDNRIIPIISFSNFLETDLDKLSEINFEEIIR